MSCTHVVNVLQRQLIRPVVCSRKTQPPGVGYETTLLMAAGTYYAATSGVWELATSATPLVGSNSPGGLGFYNGFESGIVGCILPAECSNGVLDNDPFFPGETAIDCGGACAPCTCDETTCGDGVCSEAGNTQG